MFFKDKETDIPGPLLIVPEMFRDDRGCVAEFFKSSVFKERGLEISWDQINYSHSLRNVVRGLHYQLNPQAQAKLIFVSSGEIFDVVVDLRKGSPTFGRWVGARLSSENRRVLYIPEGFAHGFCTLSSEAEIMYYCSKEYAPDLERSILWNDPNLNIAWPITNPVLSERDLQAKPFKSADNNFEYGKVRN